MTVGPGQRVFHNCENEIDREVNPKWILDDKKVLVVKNCSEIEIIDGFYKSNGVYYQDCCHVQDWVRQARTTWVQV